MVAPSNSPPSWGFRPPATIGASIPCAISVAVVGVGHTRAHLRQLAIGLTLAALAMGCSSTTPQRAAATRAGRIGFGVQTHSIVRFIVPVDIHGVSIAADAPAQGTLAEVTWRAVRGGSRLHYCTSSQQNGVSCAEARSAGEDLRGPMLIVDPVNRGRSIQSVDAFDSTAGTVVTRSLYTSDRTYEAPPNHGIWVVDSGGRHLYHCQASNQGPLCHEAMFDNRRVSPRPVLAMFQLGDAEIVWVHDVNNSHRVLRCHVQPNQPAPVCLAARGIGPEST